MKKLKKEWDLEIELMMAIEKESVEGVLSCLERGACINVELADGMPLLAAISLPNYQASLCISQLLLLQGADPNLGFKGQLPLQEAVRLNRTDIVNLLIGHGAASHSIDYQGRRPNDYVGPTHDTETAALLAGRPAGVTVQFSQYIFHEEQSQPEEDKENRTMSVAVNSRSAQASCRPAAAFLREVEKIFLADIAGTSDSVPSEAVLSDITPRLNEEMFEIASELERIGFRTPTVFQTAWTPARTSWTDMTPVHSMAGSLKDLAVQTPQDKVHKYLGIEVKPDLQPSGEAGLLAASSTPAYMRPTLASTGKRQIASESTPLRAGDKRPINRLRDRLAARSRPDNSATGTPISHSSLERSTSCEVSCVLPVGGASLGPLLGDDDSAAHVSLLGSATPQQPAAHSSTSDKISALSLADTSSLSVCQEFLLTDRLTGAAYLEKRLPSILSVALQDEALLNLLQDEAENAGHASTIISLGSLSNLSTSAIRRDLACYGEAPSGPITSDTRRAYLLRLKKLRMGRVVPCAVIDDRYPEPMAAALKNIAAITRSWEALWELETAMAAKFTCVNPELAAGINGLTRESVCKTSFNYLLLDPRLTQNLPLRVFSCDDQELWRTFVGAIFYIGKGTRSRPFHHLQEATRKKVGAGQADKVVRILDIWRSGLGVVVLQVFSNTIAVEGFTREAAMIDAVGLDNLTNSRPGDWYGPAAVWDQKRKLQLGVFLLFRAFKIFLQEGERQIRPVDLRNKN